MRFGLFFGLLALCVAPAHAKPLPPTYGYGRVAAEAAPLIDLRGRLPAAEAGPLLSPKARQIEPAPVSDEGVLAASCYDADREGGLTASGEVYRANALSAAHPDMPLSSLAMLTNARSGKEVIVRVNDRPAAGRTLEISTAVAEALDVGEGCQARLTARRLGSAPYQRPAVIQAALPATPVAAASQAAPVPARAGFVVQIGAFSQRANAEAAGSQAASVGPVQIEPATVGGAVLYRVRLGPWQSRDEAEQARQSAEAIGFGGARLTTP